MKHFVVCAVIVFSLMSASQAFAQRDSTRVLQRLDELQKALSLTADQTAKIKPILFEAQAQGRKIRDEYGEDREGARDAMREQGQKTDARIQALLTADQIKKYEEYKKERRQRMMEQQGRGPGN
jgi:Spy/CpxP family protein refolding chaperone